MNISYSGLSKDQELIPDDPSFERTLASIRREARRKKKMGDRANANGNGAQPDEEMTMRDYCFPNNNAGFGSSVVGPTIAANNFKIKPALITLIQNTVQFTGFPNEDPNQHLTDFLEACDLVKFNNVPSDAIRLRLFKYSLRDKAKAWLQSQEAGSITTWEELKKAFLQKYFPMAKSAKLRNEIS